MTINSYDESLLACSNGNFWQVFGNLGPQNNLQWECESRFRYIFRWNIRLQIECVGGNFT